MLHKILTICLAGGIFTTALAQNNPLTGYTLWNVNVKAARQVTIKTTLNDVQQCSSRKKSGTTTFTLSANMQSQKWAGKFNSSGDFQMSSSVTADIRALGAPLMGGGTAALQAANSDVQQMNKCEGKPCTETSSTAMSGNAVMVLDKSAFSFDYNNKKHTGTAHFSFGFDENQVSASGNSSTVGCNNNGGGDISAVAKPMMQMTTLAYSGFVVGNIDNDFIIDAAEETGLGYKATITAMPNNKGFTAVFSFSKTLTSEVGLEQSVTTIVSTLTMNIGQQEDVPYEAIITCADGDDTYNKYIPTGRPLPLANKDYGNSIKFYTYIVDKKTQEKVMMKFTTDYTLQSISHEAGVCNNAPMKVAADKEPDFKFTDLVGAYQTFTDTRIQTHTDKGDVPVIVTSYDYGGTAELHADVTLANGQHLTAHRLDKKLDYLEIPLDENHNDIADQWEIDNGIKGDNRDANWDEENDAGLQKGGDGFTLYEEYRGFAVRDAATEDKVFKRFSPKSLEVCYYLEGDKKEWARASFQKMQTLTQIHFIEIHNNNDLEVIGGSTYPRQVNFNSSTHQSTKNCAIFTKLCDEKQINTKPLDGVAEEVSACPNQVDVLHIGLQDGSDVYQYFMNDLPPKIPLTKVAHDWATAADLLNNTLHENIDISQVNAYALTHKDDIHQQYVCFAIMHEIGHAIGCQHHSLEGYLHDDTGYKKLAEFKTMWQTTNRISVDETLSQKERDRQIAATFKLYGYKEISSFDYFEQGEIDCPMRYWFATHTYMEILSFLAGNWKPFETSPIVKKKWEFCATNKAQIHLKMQ